jgi:hypothetical protein
MLSGIKFIPKVKDKEKDKALAPEADTAGDGSVLHSQLNKADEVVQKRHLLQQNRNERKRVLEEADLVDTTENEEVDQPKKVLPAATGNNDAARLLRQRLKASTENGQGPLMNPGASVANNGNFDIAEMKALQNKKRAQELALKMRSEGESMSVADLMAAEKLDSSNCERSGKDYGSVYDRAYADAILQSVKTLQQQADDSDDDFDRSSKSAKDGKDRARSGVRPTADKKRQRRCDYCSGDTTALEGGIIAGSAYWRLLAKPSHLQLCSLHCVLVPVEHVGSSIRCDDNALEDLRSFKKSLLRMFDSLQMTPVFLETAASSKGNSHTIIDVLPADNDQLIEAIASFKLVWAFLLFLVSSLRHTFGTRRHFNLTLISSPQAQYEYSV